MICGDPEATAFAEPEMVVPDWCSDAGPLSLYHPSKRMLASKTRLFADFTLERFRAVGFARLIGGSRRKPWKRSRSPPRTAGNRHKSPRCAANVSA